MSDTKAPQIHIDDGILFEYHEEEVISTDIAYAAAAIRKQLAGDKKMPLMVEFSRLFGFSPDTRYMDLNIILANVSAIAYCVEDNNKKIPETEKQLILSFFDKTPWPIPVKIFFNKQEGINWLKQVE